MKKEKKLIMKKYYLMKYLKQELYLKKIMN